MAHLDESGPKPLLCLHYDPNLVPLGRLEQLARDEGAQITQRFRHETLPIRGMDCGSCAASVEHVVAKVAGVTHVAVNYAGAKMRVEYDSTQTTCDAIVKAVNRLGYRVPQGEKQADSHAHPYSHSHEGENWLAKHSQLAFSLSSGLFLALGFFGERFFGLPAEVALALYLLAYVAGGYDLARHAIPTILSGRFDVEFLMLAGAVGAAILGEWAEGAFLLFLFSLGHALEGFALDRARGAIAALGNLSPKVARVRRGEVESEIPVEELQIGDIAIVRSGDRVAVDGVIRSGASSLDQSSITGESVPVEKAVGENVFAGSLNGDGTLEVEVTRLSHDTTLARVVQMVEEAQNQKAASQTFAERFERVFVPVVLGVVVLAAIVPPLLEIWTWKDAFLRAISTLVAASPCALALATPAAVLASIARAARGGVLIKGGVHLENLGNVRAFAFDKTGTLTRGRPEIASLFSLDGDETQVLRIAASLEVHASHPLAQAVTRRATEQNIAFAPATNEKNWPGRGVSGEIEGEMLRAGNSQFWEEAGVEIPAAIQSEIEKCGEMGQPTMIVGTESRIVGLIAFADPIREQTPATLAGLRALGAENLVMLTGDNPRVAAKMAERAGSFGFSRRFVAGAQSRGAARTDAKARRGRDGGRWRQRCARTRSGDGGHRDGRGRLGCRARNRRCRSDGRRFKPSALRGGSVEAIARYCAPEFVALAGCYRRSGAFHTVWFRATWSCGRVS
jgi:Cd2+/Zn2+-exporting ATPase